ncbi:chemotaxis protein CheW [Legionella sp. CNM-4043-24]|uniref:chemotaxis protein CheW n=1 Tax=Legionella sp. CNM-4043-24 TaxID=3421646 RepID=UPI00403A8B0D
MTTERKVCTFCVNDHYFGLDIAEVQEIIRYQEMTSVPLADETVSGLINLRGQIVTAIDMNVRLGFVRTLDAKQLINIVVRTEDSAVSLLVDAIGDVIDIPENSIEPAPDNVKGRLHKMLKEVCKLDDRLLLILDLEQVLKIEQEA